jgi:hypothetical protein
MFSPNLHFFRSKTKDQITLDGGKGPPAWLKFTI